jgi:hypothetical protein
MIINPLKAKKCMIRVKALGYINSGSCMHTDKSRCAFRVHDHIRHSRENDAHSARLQKQVDSRHWASQWKMRRRIMGDGAHVVG